MRGGGAPKSLKDQNRWHLWLTIVLNAAVFYAACQANAIAATGWKALFSAAINLLPVGLALVITSVANGLLSARTKERLVFFRWAHALPGHRAFSEYMHSDPRIDLEALKKHLGPKFPEEAEAENRMWYRIFKEVEMVPEVQHIHREFLLMRDYAGLSAVFFASLGSAALVLVQGWKLALIYCLMLLVQFLVVRQVAATYGVRFVCTVLAVKSAKLRSSTPRQPRGSKST